MKGVHLVVYFSIACVWHFQTHAAEQRSGTADAALEQVASATRSGDLLSVWDAYERLFDHPNREDVDGGLFLSCFRMSGCFHLDTLVNILGKSRKDVRELISGFCPHFSSWKSRVRASKSYSNLDDDAFEKVFSSARAGLHRFNGYDDSCDDWEHRIKQSASKHRVARKINPTVWPLTNLNIQGAADMASEQTHVESMSRSVSKTWWPVVSYRIGNIQRAAIVDTGTSNSVFQHDDDFPEEQFEQSGEDVLAVGLASELFRVKTGLLQVIHVGDDSFKNILASTLPPEVFVEEQDIANLDVLGMSLLLLYDSVCFAWKEQRLYLGELGPCADGTAVATEMSGRGELYIQIGTGHESARWNAFFDTGADLSHCSPELFRDNDNHIFYLSFDRELAGTCELAEDLLAADDDFLDPSFQSGIIGLDTLQQFEAWGWQRGPLTSFFVRGKTERLTD